MLQLDKFTRDILLKCNLRYEAAACCTCRAGLKVNYTDTDVASQLSDSSQSIETKSLGSARSLGDAEHHHHVAPGGIDRPHKVDWSVGDASGDSGLPPPPAQLLQPGNDSDDDFPLPPPPDLDSMPAVRVKNETSSVGNASLMHSLSVKLASRHSTLSRAPPPVAAKSFRKPPTEKPMLADHSIAASHSAAAESSVSQPAMDGNSFLSQIQRGMSLRRTVSNDRSEPRVPGKN